MEDVLAMTRRLESEWESLLKDYARIAAALARLSAAARAAGRPEYERFAHALALHAQMEELVLYPAALLVGAVVQRDLHGHAKEPSETSHTHVPLP
jgi:hypothetical protein